MVHLNFKTSSNLSLIQFNSMCLTFKHLFKHLVNKGHSIPVLVYLQDFYNNTRYCYELKCGPGQRGLSGHSQRFPSLECEAYPRDLLVDLFVVQESFYFGLRKAVTSQLPLGQGRGLATRPQEQVTKHRSNAPRPGYLLLDN